MAAPKNWHNVFEKGSKRLQDRLKEVHKNNPKFQQFLKDRGETLSAKQAQGAKKRETPAAAPTSVKPKGSSDRTGAIAAAAQKIRLRKAAASNRQSFGGELGGGFSVRTGFRRYSEGTENKSEKKAALKEQIKENLSKACWDGYEAIGMKKKGGKWVPNCVPIKEQTYGSSILNPNPKKGGKPKRKPDHGVNKLKNEESDKATKPKSKLEKAIDRYKGKKNKINTEPVANTLQPHQLGSHQISGGQDTEQHS